MQKKTQVHCNKYKFGQVFGDKQSIQNIQDQDIITSLSFDPTGRYLSLGDNAGRIIIFQTPQNNTKNRIKTYDYHAQFQSHVKEFDPLKSDQIEQKIVGVSWLRSQGNYLKLITTNSKVIKLWKAYEKTDKKILKSASRDLHMPKFQPMESSFFAAEQKTFPAIHTTPINSISHSNNEQYLLSSDSERTHLWSLQKPVKPYIVNQLASGNQQSIGPEARTRITCSKMHPTSDSLFIFGLNRNGVGISDLRAPTGKGRVLDFGVETRSTKNFFTELISNISSAEFIQNGRYVVARQYLNVKVWDVANTKKPVLNVCVQDGIKAKVCQLFQNEKLGDKFTVASSCDSSTILTGNYNNCFHLIDSKSGDNIQYELSFKQKTVASHINPSKVTPISKIDTASITSAMAYHPSSHTVAVASLNCFFLYGM